MGKQKKATKKDLQTQVNEIGGALHNAYREIDYIKQALVGTETIILHLSDFLEKREEFEDFLNEKIKERQEAEKKAQKEREQEAVKEKNI